MQRHPLGRWTAALLAALTLLLALCPAGLADTPQPISELDYDTLPAPYEGQSHYLLISYDEVQNNDGMVLLTFDTRADRIICTTISREILINRPEGGIGRITYVVKNNSPEALCRVISTHFGVKVEKYILMDYDIVDAIIDEIGGVTLTITDAEARYLLEGFEIPPRYTSPRVTGAGTYLFYGRAAVLYMRMRKGVGGEDGRTGRVRKVLEALVAKYRDATLSDAQSLLSGVVLKKIISTNMTMQDLLIAVGEALQLRGVTPETLQMPMQDAMTSITYSGMSTREVDYEACRQVLDDFLNHSYIVIDED